MIKFIVSIAFLKLEAVDNFALQNGVASEEKLSNSDIGQCVLK